MRRTIMLLALLFLVATVARMAPATQAQGQTSPTPASTAPSLKIVSPKDGDTVNGPVTVQVQVTGVTLVPSSTPAAPGQGHLHVLIDVDAPPVGQVIPHDSAHVHLADGASQTTLTNLTPGKHTLTVVFGSSSHIVTSPVLSSTVTITVAAAASGTPGSATPAVAATSTLTATLPAIPAPVAVQVDPKTTAYLVLDQTSTICARPSCVATLPMAAALLKKARDAGALVVYSDTGGNSTVLPQVAPQPNDPKVTGRADKFYGTNLDDILKGKGIKTVVIVGYVANGAVLYTAFGATLRGYTAVVAVDGTGAEDPFAVTATFYQLLNGPGSSNPQNQPLVDGRVTLSRSDLITFVAGAAPPRPAATAQPATTSQPAAPTTAPTGAATSMPTAAATKTTP